jgi:hypothetical protein
MKRGGTKPVAASDSKRQAEKVAWHDVLDETAQGGDWVERGGARSLRAKRDGLRAHGEQARVGEADAVGVAVEVVEDELAAREGGLGIEVPLDLGEGARETGKPFGVSEVVEAREAILTVFAS